MQQPYETTAVMERPESGVGNPIEFSGLIIAARNLALHPGNTHRFGEDISGYIARAIESEPEIYGGRANVPTEDVTVHITQETTTRLLGEGSNPFFTRVLAEDVRLGCAPGIYGEGRGQKNGLMEFVLAVHDELPVDTTTRKSAFVKGLVGVMMSYHISNTETELDHKKMPKIKYEDDKLAARSGNILFE